MDKVIKLVCDHFQINEDDFWKERTRSHCDARKLVQLIGYEKGMRITDLAMMFDCHHTTVIHAVKQAKNYIEVDADFKNTYVLVMGKELILNTPAFEKKCISVFELKAIIDQAYKAGLAQDEIRKERLVRLYE